jgi:hypothetical protein
MASDTLSNVLRAIRITGATFFDVEAAGAWATELRPREEIMPRLVPGADHLIACHMITNGRCFVNLAGRTPIRMETGEVVVFLRGDPHVLSSRPGMMRPNPATPSGLDAMTGKRVPVATDSLGIGPAAAKFVCGLLACEAHLINHLVDTYRPSLRSETRVGLNRSFVWRRSSQPISEQVVKAYYRD